jgi:parallel beta-helix repeat protein
MNLVFKLSAIASALTLLLLGSMPAAAETLTCTDLPTLPATIAASGHYCLNKNFTQSFATAPVNITVSNVVLDCNNHIVTNTSASAITGVYANNKSLVTVRNCTLQGFTRGIGFFETSAGLSRSNRIEHNDVRKSKLAGIQIAGASNIIDGNRVTENQGDSSSYTYGILLSSFDALGAGNVIQNNVINNIAPANYVRVVGIYLLDVQNTTVQGNSISAMYPPLDLGVYGIIGSSTVLGTSVVGNTILSAIGNPSAGGGGISYGGASYDGILFNANSSSAAHNVCRDNVVGHFIDNIFAESPSSVGCVKDSNTEF